MKTYLRINMTFVTRKADPDSNYDHGDTDTDRTLIDAEIVTQEDVYDVIADYNVCSGDDIYLVSATWSTGNSFGWDHKDCWEAFMVCRTAEHAELVANQIEETDYEVTVATENGNSYEVRIPWKGYFEYLDFVSVNRLKVR